MDVAERDGAHQASDHRATPVEREEFRGGFLRHSHHAGVLEVVDEDAANSDLTADIEEYGKPAPDEMLVFENFDARLDRSFLTEIR